jgi:hypothetical protein
MKLFSTRHGQLTGHLFALLLGTLLVAAPLRAQEYGIIDNIDIRSTPQGTQINIDFTRPAQYLGHTPKEMGKQLFIDLRLIGSTGDELQVPPEQQMRLKPTDEVPLSVVNYRAYGREGARLELEFTRPVPFTVSASKDFRGVTITLTPAVPESVVTATKASPAVESLVAKLMQQARNKMIDERDFAQTISLYQQVLDQPTNSRSREALEMLGLARERIGQQAQAKAVYEGYLLRYPEGEASDRVKQRLVSLITATLPEQKKLRTAKTRDKKDGWDMYGSFSQFYIYDSLQIEGVANGTTVSAFSSDIDLVAQRRSADSNSRARISAGQYHDLENNGDDSTRISALYAEHHDQEGKWWMRAGRQSSNHDGVLGRFDGIKLGYDLSKQTKATIFTGYPVDSSRDSLNSRRSFIGAALDLGPIADNWEFTLYGIDQQVDALTDRQAIGGELRYFRPKLTVLGLLDYDLFYNELNIGMLLANWSLENDITLNTTLDMRNSPLLTTRTALQGQGVETIEQLRTLYTDDTIYQLARDRTTKTNTMTVGLSSPLTKSLRLTGDLSVMNTSSSVASGGIEALPATDNEYFVNLQMIGTGVLNGDDISSVGFQYSNTTTATGYGLYASSRLPIGNQWRFYPRVRIDQRDWKESSQSQWRIAPIIRAEYSWKKARFEAELGTEWISRELPDDSERSTSIHGSIGYRLEF